MERATDDDIIELHKDVKDVAIYINKNITIIGNGHTIRPKDGKTALDCGTYVTLRDIKFLCQSRTNAVVIRSGGVMFNITTQITGPVRVLFPTVVQRSGTLTISNSDIMYMETYKSHGTTMTVTFFKNSILRDYYNGKIYLENGDRDLSKFHGTTSISESTVMCALFEGNCKISDSILKNFNKAVGTLELNSCKLDAAAYAYRADSGLSNEYEDGPLKYWNPKVIPYALHIAGGKVKAEKFSSSMNSDCIGFYMTSGSLDIRSTIGTNDSARHLIRGGAVVFNDVSDEGYYEIRKAKCGIVRSRVNTSMKTKPAMEQLDAMIGLDAVKKQLHTIMNTINVNMKCPEKDFGFSHHMIFAGDPGTGKTTVAKLVAQALFEIGAIPECKCMEVPASQLIKGYVGQTGEHVESIMKKALGGMLFIDEAYELMVKDGQNTFNNDALAVILRYMEDHRNELVVIAAGYRQEMKAFLASNSGLTRRFQWVDFEDYTPYEMTNIFMTMCAKYKESFGFVNYTKVLNTKFTALTEYYRSHPDAKGHTTNGGNGGLVRNAFQQVIFARNNRIASDQRSTMKIIKEDIETGFAEELKKAMNVTYGTDSVDGVI